ncbi:MAG: hypothetical protein EXS16_15500 [Gemmataceae bacterium]|nr:hypothetical protein [Gemmataceae bacterium]
MTFVLIRKLLRDVRIPWLVVAVLLFLFQILWARVTQRVTLQILEQLGKLNVSPEFIRNTLFSKNDFSGQMIQAIMGGDDIRIENATDLMSISYVHPLVITILSIWAIGRATSAIAGEIDRGTMELLLAQPIRRSQILLSHLSVDALIFPALCAVLWTGTYCGTWWMGLQPPTASELAQLNMEKEKAEGKPQVVRSKSQQIDPYIFLRALPCVFALLFAVGGVTMAMSSMGRSRSVVWGCAVSLFLTMFLVNVLGQIWSDWLGWLRPATIYYHYQPQLMILGDGWRNPSAWTHLVILVGFGTGGYAFAWVYFTRRDLPAPL